METKKGNKMNSQKILELFLDGAYQQDGKFYHPSFRKGWRKLGFGNISYDSAYFKLLKAGILIKENGITKAKI
jgi:hypothetical protein